MDKKEVKTTIKLAKNNWITFLEEFHKHKIEKSGFNKFNKYPYYRLEDIERAIVETQIKTGFNLTLIKQTPFFMEGLEYMRFEYEFNNGERTFEFIFRHDNTHKNLIQSSGSTSTYGHRYTLMRVLGIAEDIDDPDNDKNQTRASKGAKTQKAGIKTPDLKEKKIITRTPKTVKEAILPNSEEGDYVDTEVEEKKPNEVDKKNDLDIDFDMDF